MSPINYKYPFNKQIPCPCTEQEKFFYCIIEPANVGDADLYNWSINGVDFKTGANVVMSALGGSGIGAYFFVPNVGTLEYGWLAYYGSSLNAPNVTVKDKNGIDYPIYWSYYNGSTCCQTIEDFKKCVVFTYPKTDKILTNLDIYQFSPFRFNTLNGFINDDGVSLAIDFVSTLNYSLDLGSAGADVIIKGVLDQIFLNNTIVTITSNATKIFLKVSNVYCSGAGNYLQIANKWETGYQTSACP